MVVKTQKTEDPNENGNVDAGGSNDQNQGANQSTEVLDADEQELKAAEKALEDELAAGAKAADDANAGEGQDGDEGEAGESGKGEGEAQQAAGGEGKPAAKTQDGGQGGEDRSQVMIPKARLDEVLKDRDEAEQRAAYWQGRAEGSGGRKTGEGEEGKGEQQAAAEVTPDEIIAQGEKELLALAEKYEAGEVTERERVEQEIAINRTIQDAREKRLLDIQRQERGQQQQQPAKGSNDLYLDRLTAQLEVDHPYTAHIQGERHWNFLRDLAAEQLTAEGVTLTNDAVGTYTLRERMAMLTDDYGPIMTGITKEQLQSSNAGQQQGQQGQGQQGQQGQQQQTGQSQPGGMSPAAKARADKLALAEGHPPDTTNLGSSGQHEEITEARINTMTDDEIAALPETTLRKILPGV